MSLSGRGAEHTPARVVCSFRSGPASCYFGDMDARIEVPRVREVMTTILVTLSEEDNLEGVAKAMQDFHFRHVPVVDGEQLPVP